jgi:hypothetical protein
MQPRKPQTVIQAKFPVIVMPNWKAASKTPIMMRTLRIGEKIRNGRKSCSTRVEAVKMLCTISPMVLPDCESAEVCKKYATGLGRGCTARWYLKAVNSILMAN